MATLKANGEEVARFTRQLGGSTQQILSVRSNGKILERTIFESGRMSTWVHATGIYLPRGEKWDAFKIAKAMRESEKFVEVKA